MDVIVFLNCEMWHVFLAKCYLLVYHRLSCLYLLVLLDLYCSWKLLLYEWLTSPVLIPLFLFRIDGSRQIMMNHDGLGRSIMTIF